MLRVENDGSLDFLYDDRGDFRTESSFPKDRDGFESYLASRRFAGSRVEGERNEFVEIAKSVLDGVGVEFKRCAVRVDDTVAFWSPRNSNGTEEIYSLDEVKEWARNFLESP